MVMDAKWTSGNELKYLKEDSTFNCIQINIIKRWLKNKEEA